MIQHDAQHMNIHIIPVIMYSYMHWNLLAVSQIGLNHRSSTLFQEGKFMNICLLLFHSLHIYASSWH